MRRCGLQACNPLDTQAAIGPLASGQLGGSPAQDVVGGGVDTPFLYVYLGAGDGSFSAPVTVFRIDAAAAGLADLATGDLDGDGHLDVAATNPSNRLVAVAYGDGEGDLRSGPSLTLDSVPGRIALGDLTGDGRLDAVVATDAGVVVLRGTPTGFEVLIELPTGGAVTDLALVDLEVTAHWTSSPPCQTAASCGSTAATDTAGSH
jgi:hypothetical protein